MLTSGFFNSVDGDRKYNAEQMSQMFEGLIGDGIFESVGGKFKVSANSGSFRLESLRLEVPSIFIKGPIWTYLGIRKPKALNN